MKNHLLLGILLFASTASFSQFQARLDSFMNHMEEHDKVMGSLSLRKDGKEIYRRSIGMEDMEAEKAASGKTLYRIGSISKTFTAAIIMQMIEEDKLKLSTPLSEFYPELPNADSITVQQLLSHRSGLHNFTNDPEYPTYMTQARSREELLEIFKSGEADFLPGERMEYSNTNYVLLSFIAEEIDKKAFDEIFENRITKPLNLESTFVGTTGERLESEAKSYSKTGDWQEAPVTHMSIPMGAGAVISTPGEVTEFFSALFTGKVIPNRLLEQMKTEEMGVFEFPFGEQTAYAHNGGIDGFQSNATYFPQEKMAIAFTGNGLEYSMNDFMIGVLSIYFGEEYDFPEFKEAITVSSETLNLYTGKYTSPDFPLEVTINNDNGILTGKATGQSSFPLEAIEQNVFRYLPAGLVLEFQPDKDEMILKQGGGTYTFTRTQ